MTDKEYEEECKLRISGWHGELKNLRSKDEIATIKALIDAELAIAEVRIKVRQAGHPKLILWLSILFPTLGAILGAILGGLLKR